MSIYPVVPVGTKTLTFESLADGTSAASPAGVIPAAGTVWTTITDASGASGFRGFHMFATYRRVGGLGAFVRRVFGDTGMLLAAFDTPLTGTTGPVGGVTVSIRASGSVEVENRSGSALDITVSFSAASPV